MSDRLFQQLLSTISARAALFRLILCRHLPFVPRKTHGDSIVQKDPPSGGLVISQSLQTVRALSHETLCEPQKCLKKIPRLSIHCYK